MKLNVIAMAGALLALTAAAAQASPSTVIPDTVHHIGSGARQIVSGTGKGISDQYHHDVAAGRRTYRDARHGRLLHHHHHHHYRHHYHRHMYSHHHMFSHHAGVQAHAGGGYDVSSHTHNVVQTKSSGPAQPASGQPQG